jgi:hypothetical protein
MEEEDEISISTAQGPNQYAQGLDVMASLRNAKNEDEIRSILSQRGGGVPSQLTASQARAMSEARQQQGLAVRQSLQMQRQRQNEFANNLSLQNAELERKKFLLNLQQQQNVLKKEVSAANAMNQVLRLDPQDIQFTQKLQRLKMTNPDVIDVLSDRVHGNEFYKTHIAPLEEQNSNIMKSLKDRLINSGINMSPEEFVVKSGSLNEDGTANWESLETVIAPIQQQHLANLKAAEEAALQRTMERNKQIISGGAESVTGKIGETPTVTYRAPDKVMTAEEMAGRAREFDPTGTRLGVAGVTSKGEPVIKMGAEDEKVIPLKEAFPSQFSDGARAGVEFPGQAGGTAAFMEAATPTEQTPSSLPAVEEEVTTEEQPARKPLGEIF